MPVKTPWKISEAHRVIETATFLLKDIGVNEVLKGSSGLHRSAEINDFSLLMITPFNRLETGHGDYRYGLDIWWSKSEGRKKVFSALWNPKKKWADPLCLTTFQSGSWLPVFLELQT